MITNDSTEINVNYSEYVAEVYSVKITDRVLLDVFYFYSTYLILVPSSTNTYDTFLGTMAFFFVASSDY